MAGFRRVPTPALLISSVLLLSGATPSSCALNDVEREFVKVPSPAGARESLKFITSKPHVAGTPGDHEVSAQTRQPPRVFMGRCSLSVVAFSVLAITERVIVQTKSAPMTWKNRPRV